MIMVTEPVGSYLNDIILRLGGFHAEMSFFGAIGHLMDGSGLRELMELIQCSSAHVLWQSHRAVRAHLHTCQLLVWGDRDRKYKSLINQGHTHKPGLLIKILMADSM